MLRWAALFCVLAIIAGVFGLGDLSREPDTLTRSVVLACLGLGVMFLALGFWRHDR